MCSGRNFFPRLFLAAMILVVYMVPDFLLVSSPAAILVGALIDRTKIRLQEWSSSAGEKPKSSINLRRLSWIPSRRASCDRLRVCLLFS